MRRYDRRHPPDERSAVSGAGRGRSEIRRRGLEWVVGPEDPVSESADLDYSINQGTLRIAVMGPLDLRCVFRLLGIGQAVDDSISTCLIDLTGVSKVFDSGIAALVLLARELTKRGVEKIRIRGLAVPNSSLAPYLM